MINIMNKDSETAKQVEQTLFGCFSKIFLVNVNTGEYEIYKNDGLLDEEGFREVPDIYAYMKKLIEEFVYPEYATVCMRFTNPEYVRKSVFSGEKRIVQSYRRRTAVGDKWITFAIITGSDCSPENPNVLFTWREADSDAITLLDTLPTISSLYDKLIRINLSNNTFEPVVVDADEQQRLVGGVINMYEWWAGYSKNGNIAAEDMGAFSALTKAGSLQKRFAEDRTPVSFRYRRKVGNELRWMQLQIAPSVEYSEENQIMLLSLKDIHEEYTAEMQSRQKLIDTMNTDALTGLYNRLKFNADLESLSGRDDVVLTVLYIDVNGLHEMNNHLGHQKGDDMLCCIADTLKAYFPDERVYRIGGDEYVVTSIHQSREEMARIIAQARQELQKKRYEISVGIESGSCQSNIEKLVATAEAQMRSDKAAYYMRNGDRRRKRQMNEELEQMLVKKQDSERFLEAIAHQFSIVFFVDLAKDTLRHIYIPDFFSQLLKETDGCFSAAMRLYLKLYVVPECHALFDDVLDYDKLARRLRENGPMQFSYRKVNGAHMGVRILESDTKKSDKHEVIWIIAEEPQ